MRSLTHARNEGRAKAATVLLWTVQSLLAALFCFAGLMKLAMPLAPVAQLTGVPVAFLQFIAVVELLGALGLILPGLLHIRPALTPLAAIGLVGVMSGAAVLTVTTQGLAPALFPAIAGTLLVTVIRGRRQWFERPAPAQPAARAYAVAALRRTQRAA